MKNNLNFNLIIIDIARILKKSSKDGETKSTSQMFYSLMILSHLTHVLPCLMMNKQSQMII